MRHRTGLLGKAFVIMSAINVHLATSFLVDVNPKTEVDTGVGCVSGRGLVGLW